MEEVKRWGFWHNKEWEGQPGEFEPMPEGPYVLYSDYLAEQRKRVGAEAERNKIRGEMAMRDFAQDRASSISLSYGTYDEIQKSLSSEIALHEAWTKRATEAEARLHEVSVHCANIEQRIRELESALDKALGLIQRYREDHNEDKESQGAWCSLCDDTDEFLADHKAGGENG